MKLRLPSGFLEALFCDETYLVNIENCVDKVVCKQPTQQSSAHPTKPEMPKMTKKIQEILQNNIIELKDAYYEDLKTKFPGVLTISIVGLTVKFIPHGHNTVLWDNTYLTSVFKDALSTYTNRNGLTKTGRGIGELLKTYENILRPFFQQHNWEKGGTDASPYYYVKVKDANQLQIIFSQILHLLECDESLDQHLVKNWKEFFDK